MRVLLGYLWKEWRDHRAVLIGMLLAVPLLLAVMGLSLPRTALDVVGQRADFPEFAALACLVLFVVSLATDLVPGEARRGHRWFLERLPAGLNAAFRGKLVLFALGAALFAAYGYVAGAVTCRLVAGEWPPVPSPGATTWILAIAALWAFAVSCSLPRGALSLPALGALALLLALPVVLLWMLFPSRVPEGWWRWESAALWAAGAVVAAWAAFSRRGFLRAGRACLTVGAICAMPYWADAAKDAWDWQRHSVVTIRSAYLGEGARYAFVNRIREGANYRSSPVPPVILDLRTGDVREAGGKFSGFSVDWVFSQAVENRYVLFRTFLKDEPTVLDARVAEPASPTDDDWREARRTLPTWRLPDGRAAWFHDGRLEADAPDGGVTVLMKGLPSKCGLGFEFWAPQRAYYDPVRGRSYSYREIALREGWQNTLRNAALQVWIRPGAWLAKKGGEFRLFDPDASTFAPALGLEATDSVSAILDDGRILVSRKGKGPFLVSPETGQASRIAVPKGFEGGALWDYRETGIRTPGGKRVFMLCRDARVDVPPGPYRSCFVRQDGDAFVPTASFESWTFHLGCPAEDTLIVHDGFAIYRLRFGSDEKEEIWRAR